MLFRSRRSSYMDVILRHNKKHAFIVAVSIKFIAINTRFLYNKCTYAACNKTEKVEYQICRS